VADIGGLKQRVEVLEPENRRLTEANEALKRDCRPILKKDLTNLEQEPAKLKHEMRATIPKAEPLAPLAPDVAVPPAPRAAGPARKSSSSPPPAKVMLPPLKPTPVNVSPAAPPKQAKQFSPSVKKRKMQVEESWGRNKRIMEVKIDVPDGIIMPGLSSCLDELIAVVGLRRGSSVTGGRMLRFEIGPMISL
jgi:hypothetical protein